MVQPVVPNHNLPLVLSQEVLGVPQIGNILPSELVSYHIIFQFIQAGGELEWDLSQS